MATGDEYYTELLKVTVSYTGERNIAENVFYASCGAAHGATLDSLQSTAESIAVLWHTNFKAFFPTGITIQQVAVSDWTDAEGLTGLYVDGTAGTMEGDPMTDQVATLLNYTTNLRYRGGRGRMYLPGPTVSAIETGDSWSSDFVGDVEAGAATVMDGVNELEIGAAELQWSLYHRGTTHVPQGVEPVLVITCSPTPGTQRRRVRRVGHKR